LASHDIGALPEKASPHFGCESSSRAVAGDDDGCFLADLAPSPAFEELARVQGAHGERPQELPAALARVRDAVVNERRQAVVNVICP
jgi:hypothetical protein